MANEFIIKNGFISKGNSSTEGTFSSYTISATTYQNLPTDVRVTGGTYSSGTATFTNNTGGTFNVTGFSTSSSLTVGTTPITSGTVGRILFQGTGDVTQQDSNLFWDNTNKRLGIGATPASAVRLDVRAQGALSTDIAFRVRNSADTQNSFEINGLGQGRIKSTGFAPRFAIGYDFLGADRNSFVFTQNIQNFRGQEWTFDAGYNGSFEGLQISNDLTGNDKGQFTIQLNNFCFGTNMLNNDTGTAERRVLRIANGVAPTTSKADEFKFYSADIVAGNAAPHFRTENGNIIKLYKETTGVTSSDFVVGVGTAVTDTSTFDGYTIGQITKTLRNLGVLS